MGFFSTVKKGLTFGIKPKKWIGTDSLKRNGKDIVQMYQQLVEKKPTSDRRENFSECMQRYGLSEADVQKRMKKSQRTAYGFLAVGGAALVYAIYWWTQGRFLPGILSIVMTLLLSAHAFREHFNYFQIKQRRLGCTFSDWLAFVSGKKKSAKGLKK